MEKSGVIDIYNIIAFHFDKTRAYQWSWITDFLNNTEINSKILDIGCGNGRNMELENRVFTGIDNSSSFIEICQRKNLNVKLMDMCNLEFPDNSFDNTVCIASFHHLSDNERRLKALKEMKRITKGNILLSVWSIEQPKKTRVTFDKYGDTMVPWVKDDYRYDRYYYIFKIDELKTLFESVGLKIKSHDWDCGNEVFTLVS